MNSIFLKQFLITLLIVCSFFFYAKDRYRIAVDQQDKPCLTQRYFFIDTWAKPEQFVQGELMAYSFHLQNALIPYQTVILKRVTALPGSTVTFDAFQANSNNKTFRGNISEEMQRLGVNLPPDAKLNLAEKEFFLMGTTKWSYDSRFWGAAKSENVVGKGYALF